MLPYHLARASDHIWRTQQYYRTTMYYSSTIPGTWFYTYLMVCAVFFVTLLRTKFSTPSSYPSSYLRHANRIFSAMDVRTTRYTLALPIQLPINTRIRRLYHTLGRFSMVDTSTIGILSAPTKWALEAPRRELYEYVSFGAGTLLVVEPSSLENRPWGCDLCRYVHIL